MKNSTIEQHEATLNVRAIARHYPQTRGGEREYQAKTRIYFWPEGETILDYLMSRRTQPYEFYRKQLLEVLRRIGWGDLKRLPDMRWSQKAGCSCGCSPGFVLSRTLRGPDGRPIDIYVNIS